MGRDNKFSKQGKREKGMGKKSNSSFQRDDVNNNSQEQYSDGTTNYHDAFSENPHHNVIRKEIDPETKTYFSEIANLFETSGIDLEERSVICSNALEEAKGKEFELATDYIISHTMQSLLEGCDVDHLCGFLRSCAELFPVIASDRCGSHVAETALKSLATFVQDDAYYSAIEQTLSPICQVIAANPADMMYSQHGSHVLRTLLCLYGGARLDSPEIHGSKSPSSLANRLNLQATRVAGSDSLHIHQGFPGLLKSLVSAMLKLNGEGILVDQCSSLVLQAALKLLEGNDEELLHVIPGLLGCRNQNLTEGNLIDLKIVRKVVVLMKETAFSHLMEVILKVAPESLFQELLMKVFRNSLFKLSSDRCGNFAIQALISHTRDREQVKLIWEELGPKCKDLLEMGRSGVIGSFIAASQRLNTCELECCQALATAVSAESDESPRWIIPRILFLENYFRCEDKVSWGWPNGLRMHVMGSLILQAIFKFPAEFIQPYITSFTCMEVEHVLEVAKDAGGARVLEAFLDSAASGKQKRRVISKLRGHFGELAKNPSGCFTVEKCFTASNLSLREAIASDLLAVQAELEHSKTKQSPYLLRKLDIDGYGRRADQWRSKQESKQAAYKDFCVAFGKTEDATHSSKGSKTEEMDEDMGLEEDPENGAAAAAAAVPKGGKKTKKKKKLEAEAAAKATESASHEKVPFLSEEMQGKKRKGKNGPSNPWKKIKA
ncbi:Pumilio homolog 23 [Linum perenne]